MKSMPLNLRNAKKVAADKHSSTFILPKGHKIQIAHGSISPLQREQIKAMPLHRMAAGGATVQDYDQIPLKENQKGGAPAQSEYRQPINYVAPQVLGQDPNYSGVVVPMARGGKPSPTSDQEHLAVPNFTDFLESHPEMNGAQAPPDFYDKVDSDNNDPHYVTDEDEGDQTAFRGGKIKARKYASGTADAEPEDPDMQPDEQMAQRLGSAASFGMKPSTLSGIDQYPIPQGQQDIPALDDDQAQIGNRQPQSAKPATDYVAPAETDKNGNPYPSHAPADSGDQPGWMQKFGHVVGSAISNPDFRQQLFESMPGIGPIISAYNTSQGVEQDFATGYTQGKAGMPATVVKPARPPAANSNGIQDQSYPLPMNPGPSSSPQLPPPQPTGAADNINVNDIYSKGLTAIQDKTKAEADLANSQAQAEKNNQMNLVTEQANWDAQNRAMQQQIGYALDDVQNGHINPRQYMENQTATQKVATGIGLLLGGFSGGYSGSNYNPAMDFLNKQIDRDIAGQKANQENRINVYNGYLNQFKNNVVAENMTRATQNGIYASQIRQAAAKAGSPMANANGEAAAAQLEQQILPLVNNAHLMQQMSQFNGTNGSASSGSEAQFKVGLNAASIINPDLYKDYQSRYVPGVGVASHAIAEADQERLANLNSLIPLVNKAVNDQTGYGNTGAWSVKNRADAQSDKEALQVSLNKLTGLSRLNDAEYKNYGQQIGNVGGVNMGGTLETLKNLQQQAQTDRNSAMQNMGITPFSDAQQPTGLNPQQQKVFNLAMKQNPGSDPAKVIQVLRKAGKI